MSLVEAIEHDTVQTESRKGDVVLKARRTIPVRPSGSQLERCTTGGDSPVRVGLQGQAVS
jgi:hypothetical protein